MKKIREIRYNRRGKPYYGDVIKATNAIEPAAPASVWGYKGCAGKGGRTLNAVLPNSEK